MKKIIVCILLIVSVSNGLIKSQNSSEELPGALEKLFGRLRAASSDTNRLRINDSIKLYIEDYVSSDKIFKNSFSNLRYLGQITSPDSLVKIITWNLVLIDEPGRYYCYFIRRSPDGSMNNVFSLNKAYDDRQILADTIYNQSDWYGALYYDIKPFTSENRKSWILLGISYSNPLMTRKLIEVLNFTAEGKIIFGRKWFDTGSSINCRHILEYSSGAVISLRFSTDSSIVFDHLVPLPPSAGDDRIYYGPDHSYDAYSFQDGRWILSINIDARNMEKQP
jgi:hypothetical protein